MTETITGDKDNYILCNVLMSHEEAAREEMMTQLRRYEKAGLIVVTETADRNTVLVKSTGKPRTIYFEQAAT